MCGVFDFDGISFNVVSLYAPNRDPSRSDFFHFVSDQVDPSVPTIIFDRRGSDPSLCQNSSVSLLAFFEECCTVDVWRYLNPRVPAFTWSKPDGTLSSRIDLIGCPFPWLDHISSCSNLPCPYSDHSGVLCGICLRYSRRSMLRKTSSSLLDSLACHLKSRWAEEGEASTRFCLRLEKQCGTKD